MENKHKGKRALLSEHNTRLALGAIDGLKQSHCKLNLSDLINEIVEIYFQKHYSKSKKSLEKKFFDKQKFLKKLILSEKGEVLDRSLKDYLKQVKAPKKETDAF